MDQVDIKLVGFFIFRFLSDLLNTRDLLRNQWAFVAPLAERHFWHLFCNWRECSFNPRARTERDSY